MAEPPTPHDPFNGWQPEQYRAMAAKVIEKAGADRAAAAAYVHSVSTWMIGQLFVGNAGAITLLHDSGKPLALGLFLAGLVSSFLCGLTAWRHALIEFETEDRFADARILVDPTYFPTLTPKEERRRSIAFNLPVGFGSLSGLLFLAGALTQMFG